MVEQYQSPGWFSKAKAKESFVVDLAFLVLPTFYIGDENDPDQLRSNNAAINIPLPEIGYAPVPKGSQGTFASLADVKNNPSELVDYYNACLELCRRYGKRPSTKKHYFWLRPVIRENEMCLIDFPWYDTYGEFKRWADAILTSSEPRLFWDADQGWELDVWQSGDHFYFRRGSPDAPDDEAECYRFPKSMLRPQIEQLGNDCVATLKRISANVELDFMAIDNSLKLLDAKVKQSDAHHEAERIHGATNARLWWKFWK